METKDSLESLKNSLIYTMSLGSRELYHSNVWAWLINHDYHFIKVFFKDFDESKYKKEDLEKVKARRESDHFDLCFNLTNIDGEEEFFIIENKIKSFITTKQLDKYTEVIKNKKIKNKDTKKYEHYESKNVHAIYTGIKDNLNGYESKIDDSFTVNWSFRSYEEIGETINDIVGTPSDDTGKNIQEYADTVLAMSQTLSKLLFDKEDFFTYETNIDKKVLENLGLYDIYKKMKVADFANYVRQTGKFKELEQLAPEGYVLDIWTGFSNTHPIFDIRFKREVETKKIDKKGNIIKQSLFEIGIQIEDGMYRYACLTMKDDSGKVTKDNFFDVIADNSKPVWFIKDFNQNDNAHGEKIQTPSKGKKFGTYEEKASNGYIFIYQYSKLDFKNPLTYEELLVRIYKDLKDAINVIESLRNNPNLGINSDNSGKDVFSIANE